MEDSSSTNSTTQLRQEELIFGTNNKKQWPVVTCNSKDNHYTEGQNARLQSGMITIALCLFLF